MERKYIRIAGARARLSHKCSYGVTPLLVVCCLLVRSRSFGITVNLNQYKPCRVIEILHNIEPRNARFLDALPGILDARFFELFYRVRLYAYVYMDDLHAS